MKPKPKNIVLFSLATLFFSGLVVAEQPERGRMPDGRAFRRDVKGTEVIDYIAELEVGIEELQRRVGGLEGEVRDKQTALDRCSGGEKMQPAQIPAKSAPSETLGELHQTISSQEQEIQRLKLLVQEKEKQATQVQTIQKSKISVVPVKKTEQDQDVQQKRESGPRASFRRALAPSINVQQEILRRDRHSANALIKIIQKKSEERADIFQTYHQNNPAVQFTETPLVAKSNRSLKDIQGQLSIARSRKQIALVQKDLQELKNILTEDIALIQRMNNSRG